MYTVYNNIIGKSLKFPDRATGWSNGAKQLIEGLLQRRPKQRLSHDGLQSHAWFSDITWCLHCFMLWSCPCSILQSSFMHFTASLWWLSHLLCVIHCHS